MRFLSIFSALVLALALVACGGSTGDAVEDAASSAAETAGDAAETVKDAAHDAVDAVAAYAVGDEVTLTGKAGCGHCNYQQGTSCSMAMEADGVVYILDGIDEDTEAFNQRMSGKEITVVGTVASKGDVVHVTVDSYDM